MKKGVPLTVVTAAGSMQMKRFRKQFIMHAVRARAPRSMRKLLAAEQGPHARCRACATPRAPLRRHERAGG